MSDFFNSTPHDRLVFRRSSLTSSDPPCNLGSVTGGGGYIPEDARSHLSALSNRTGSRDPGKSRSIGDLTGKGYLTGTGTGFGLALSRQGNNESRK